MNETKKSDSNEIRSELAEVIERQRMTKDEARPEAVQRRHQKGQRTIRENISDFLDDYPSIEYGSLAVAAQRRRTPMEELIKNTPADGVVTTVGKVNSHLFDQSKTRCVVIGYDYTVLAGTQGFFNHKKKDRMLEFANKRKLPTILFAEGGGGRPGDVDMSETLVAGLEIKSFSHLASLSGLVPVIGIVSGYCFAGNATLLACCDVIIAAKNTNIGMAGPAMIEGGGLGRFEPHEIGPVSVQSPNGVIDIVVEDDAEAVEKAKQYMSYFQGSVSEWECKDQNRLRDAVPQRRRRAYDVRRIIDIVADKGSVLELRREFGKGIVTALIRIEGHPFGLVANNTFHLGGAVDADSGDKLSRFAQLCDAFDIPMVSLIDTPGFMVGPEAEKTAQVRHFGRIFTNFVNITVPVFSIVLRRGYGLAAMAMAGGSFHNSDFIVSWPTGEFGGMGLEGAVRLGYRKELEAIEDPEKREQRFNELLAMYYEHGKAINMASCLEIDNVIDPAETRQWIISGLDAQPEPEPRSGKKRPNVDCW
ncbi:MAG: biotin carboxylase [Desulfobacterales bacterium]|nr:biotin carboxylase [Desulfobacterales bacterium]